MEGKEGQPLAPPVKAKQITRARIFPMEKPNQSSRNEPTNDVTVQVD